jgi:hypothetical protein
MLTTQMICSEWFVKWYPKRHRTSNIYIKWGKKLVDKGKKMWHCDPVIAEQDQLFPGSARFRLISSPFDTGIFWWYCLRVFGLSILEHLLSLCLGRNFSVMMTFAIWEGVPLVYHSMWFNGTTIVRRLCNRAAAFYNSLFLDRVRWKIGTVGPFRWLVSCEGELGPSL